MTRLPIQIFLQSIPGSLVLDVRSPGEYESAHLPGARNLPLFTNAERAEVGTAYKQKSREAAIKIGLDHFGPKMRPMVETVEQWLQETGNTRRVAIYCWRGGMRSGAVAWLLNLYGFEVQVLTGGYKAFRRWTLDRFEQPHCLKVLGGYTGSGKTLLLEELARRGEYVIDLEALACHKGSAFGKMDQPQPSQEMFENKLALELDAAAGRQVWLEDESQRIGTVNIPKALWLQMRSSPLFFLDIPFDERLRHILQEYGQIAPDRLRECTERIAKRFGPLETKLTLAHLESGEIEAAFRLLLQYYDKRYRKGLHNREALDTLLTELACPAVSAENAQHLLPKPTVL